MKTVEKLKYFIYARKSSESEDRQMASIESQIDELKKIAEQNSLSVIDILQESKSAKAPGRLVFNKMLERIHNGEAQGIICWKLNRLARNPVDGGNISWMLQQGSIRHIQTFGRSYYPSDNVIMMAVELGMANQFIRDLSVDTKRGLRSKAERGWFPGFVTLGYIHNPLKKKGEKEVLIDPERFYLVRKMFDLILTGQYNVPQILKIATDQWGLRGRQGKKVSLSNLYRIFTNTFYYGKYEFPIGSGNWYEGKHVPMITKLEYEKIQRILGSRGVITSNQDFAFRGPIRCGHCGCLITAEAKNKVQKNGNQHNYVYYHCTGKRDPNCPKKSVEEKALEKQIVTILESIEIPQEFTEWALNILKTEQKEEVESRTKILTSQRKQYDSVLFKIDNLIRMRANAELTEEEFATSKKSLLEEKDRIEEVLKSSSQSVNSWIEDFEKSLTFAEKAKLSFENGSLAEKKAILYALGSNLSLKDKILSIELPESLKFIKKALPEVKNIHRGLEPLNNVENKELLWKKYTQSSVLLRRQGSNL